MGGTFNLLQPVLLSRFKLHDSCGVHNLHGMPALVGAIVVAVVVAIPGCQPDTVKYPDGDHQPWAQLAGAAATLAFAIVSGLGAGFIVKRVVPSSARAAVPSFTDAPFWTVAEKME